MGVDLFPVINHKHTMNKHAIAPKATFMLVYYSPKPLIHQLGFIQTRTKTSNKALKMFLPVKNDLQISPVVQHIPPVSPNFNLNSCGSCFQTNCFFFSSVKMMVSLWRNVSDEQMKIRHK